MSTPKRIIPKEILRGAMAMALEEDYGVTILMWEVRDSCGRLTDYEFDYELYGQMTPMVQGSQLPTAIAVAHPPSEVFPKGAITVYR